jgi:dTDP-4-amino-4,6-dideoxygalactose transaminase
LAKEASSPLAPPWPPPDEDVRAALVAAYADGSWGRYSGPHTQRLVELLTAMHVVKHAWLCSSGTIAVELALRGLKVGPGDEVILAAYDFPGNFRAVEAIGARPVLIDLAPETWHLDAERVGPAVSPQTKAVIVSHLHGSLADMQRVCEVAAKCGLAVVEDACQVPGATVQGRPAGSWGDCGVLSFGGSKLLTAGRGGAVLTSRDDALQRIKIFSQRGNEAFPLSELQAAVLIPQLSKLAAANERRLASVRKLLALVSGMTGIVSGRLPIDASSRPAFYKLPWLVTGNNDACDSPQFEGRRGQFIAAAQAEGVMLDEGFRGFVRRTAGRCRVAGEVTIAERAAAGTVLLHHPVLLETDDTICRVAEALERAARVLDR